MKKQELKEKLQPFVRGSMVGLAIGDALGMPVESMTYAEIMALTNDKGITDFIAPVQKKFKSCRTFLPGQWTDDTQLALAVAKSLIRSKGFNLKDQALAHIEAYKESTRGWGGTTRNAIKEIMNGLRKPDEPAKDKPGGGAGNGVAIKIAPLAIFHAIRQDNKFIANAVSLGQMTHQNFKASFGALLIGEPIIQSIYQHSLNNATSPNNLNFRLLCARETLDEVDRKVVGKEKSFRHCLPLLIKTKNADELRGITGMGFHVVDTVCFSLGICKMFPDNFETALIETVNSGGDADSDGAMVGAILGANLGIDAIPAWWLDGLYKIDEIIEVADDLLDVSLEQNS